MRTLAVAVMLSCGAPESNTEPQPRIVIPGKVTPWLHVEGDTDADGRVVPTGVALNARADGWRVSCLNGAVPRLVPDGQSALRLFCGHPAGEF